MNHSGMNRIKFLLIFFLSISFTSCFAQLAGDGSYMWNISNVNYSINAKTSLFLNTKMQFSNQTDQLDFAHAELTAFRKLTPKFSMGLGYRQTESYKLSGWYAGHNYLLYGVCFFSPANVNIKFANRLVYKTFRNAESQIGLDNITNVDFFAGSVNRIPKPYLADEVFSELKSFQLQNVRLYGGLHMLKMEYLTIDLFYCYWLTCPEAGWKNYNVYGLSTKLII